MYIFPSGFWSRSPEVDWRPEEDESMIPGLDIASPSLPAVWSVSSNSSTSSPPLCQQPIHWRLTLCPLYLLLKLIEDKDMGQRRWRLLNFRSISHNDPPEAVESRDLLDLDGMLLSEQPYGRVDDFFRDRDLIQNPLFKPLTIEISHPTIE
ncbi:hypothetical protein K469DRAFT_92874 [Zopfia rhizophila CBS 207.26]|uniref:Uncharacterized protein n=1 Tax=Zopfia rhizophila CBS 207.26 TaxID=1314779 RepID=A0A6A6EB35_9PEZI|nr:hypothetical protein K469DRAFT_92874 [Zopfia rhizophila CBS 207.26]